jgi:hypothetical protein
MMLFTDITGMIGVSICILLIILRCLILFGLNNKQTAMLAGLVFFAALVPFGGLSAVEFVRGIVGDLSITTLLLLGLALLSAIRHRQFTDEISGEQRSALLMLIALAALVFYPLALGVGMFDPYRLGFGNLWFIGGLLLLALIAWKQQYTLVALSIALAVLVWSGGWYESNNLWDYLLDPWVSIYALGIVIKLGVSTWRKKSI